MRRDRAFTLALLIVAGCSGSERQPGVARTNLLPPPKPNWNARELLDRARWLLADDDLLDPKKVEGDLAVRIGAPEWLSRHSASAPIEGWLASSYSKYIYATEPVSRSAGSFRAILRLSLSQAPCITVYSVAQQFTAGWQSMRSGPGSVSEFHLDQPPIPMATNPEGTQQERQNFSSYGLLLRYTNTSRNWVQFSFPFTEGGSVGRCAATMDLARE